MRVLVFGGNGMLGHELCRTLAREHEVGATFRLEGPGGSFGEGSNLASLYPGVDVRDLFRVSEVLADFRPDAIVNAAGIVKQREDAKQAVPSIEVNALFPHRLSVVARAAGARVIHISTDCVFSGRQGGYRESDGADPVDLYGATKLLGEVEDGYMVTLRTSMVGLEVTAQRGLVEWALRQSGQVPGYRRAIFSGLTTRELSRVICRVLTSWRELPGIWHVASEPISKFDLLTMLFRKLNRTEVLVVPDDSVVFDRSLRADAFAEATGYRPPSWSAMLDELVEDIRAREG